VLLKAPEFSAATVADTANDDDSDSDTETPTTTTTTKTSAIPVTAIFTREIVTLASRNQ
jgi:hypothetical protein